MIVPVMGPRRGRASGRFLGVLVHYFATGPCSCFAKTPRKRLLRGD